MRLLAFLLTLVFFTTCDSASATQGPTTANGQTTTRAESPEIKLTIENAPLEGAMLIGQFMDQQYRADTATVVNGTIIFSRNEPYEPGHYYAYLPNGVGIQLLIDQDQTFSMSADMNDVVRTMEVEGNQDTELLYEALKFEETLQPRFQDLANRRSTATPGSNEYNKLTAERQALVQERTAYLNALFEKAPNSLFTAFKRAGQNPELRTIKNASGQTDELAQVADFRYHFWDNVDFNDPRLLRTPVINNKLERYIKKLTPQNADSLIVAADRLIDKTNYTGKFFEFFANWITLAYEPGKSPVMDAEAIHVNMINKYFTRERAVWSDSMTVYGLRQRAGTMANSLIGQKAPDITVPGVKGKGQRLYDLKKPYLVVFMYNPDCDHCIEQTPKLTALYPKIKDEVDVYAIALDTERAKWESFLTAYGMDQFTNVFDPTNRTIVNTFYVDNTPELYLIDEDRNIVAKNLKVNQLEAAIRLDKAKKN